jgi:hypothetical protein
VNNPASKRISDDLPEPFAPMSAASVPRRKLREALQTTSGNPAA